MPKGQHYAHYGNVVMEREYCVHCCQYSILIDAKLTCCGNPTVFDTTRSKRMSQAQDGRKRQTAAERQTILELQGNRCLYCDMLFNSAVERKGRLIYLKVNWDHFVPFAYSQNNYAYNFVAACQICNGIKGSSTFRTLEEARVYVMAIRTLKGIREDRDGGVAS